MRLKTLNNWLFHSLRKKYPSYADLYENYFVPSRIVRELSRQAALSLTVKYHQSKLLHNAYLGLSFSRRSLFSVFSQFVVRPSLSRYPCDVVFFGPVISNNAMTESSFGSVESRAGGWGIFGQI